MELIDKSALVAEIKKHLEYANNGILYAQTGIEKGLKKYECDLNAWQHCQSMCKNILSFIDTLEVKEVGVWKTVDNINPQQADRNKIYCVFTKDRHILATVINHPKDEELLQWKCTEFPFHRYDMCEGDKYMQIV